MKRRTILVSGGVSLSGALAGCLDSLDGDGDGTDRGSDDWAVSDHAPRLAVDPPESAADDRGVAVLVGSEDEADRLLSVEELPTDDAEYVSEFVEETAFDDAVLVFLELYVPQPDYDLEIEAVDVDGGTIAIDAVAEKRPTDEAVPAVEVLDRALARVRVDRDEEVEAVVAYRDHEIDAVWASALLE